MDSIAICEMSTADIKKELSVRRLELSRYIPGKTFRIWLQHRVYALEYELDERMKRGE